MSLCIFFESVRCLVLLTVYTELYMDDNSLNGIGSGRVFDDVASAVTADAVAVAAIWTHTHTFFNHVLANTRYNSFRSNHFIICR